MFFIFCALPQGLNHGPTVQWLFCARKLSKQEKYLENWYLVIRRGARGKVWHYFLRWFSWKTGQQPREGRRRQFKELSIRDYERGSSPLSGSRTRHRHQQEERHQVAQRLSWVFQENLQSLNLFSQGDLLPAVVHPVVGRCSNSTSAPPVWVLDLEKAVLDLNFLDLDNSFLLPGGSFPQLKHLRHPPLLPRDRQISISDFDSSKI